MIEENMAPRYFKARSGDWGSLRHWSISCFWTLGTMQHLREKVIMRLIGLAGYQRLLRYAKCEEGNIE
jgi:hypothetical protein